MPPTIQHLTFIALGIFLGLVLHEILSPPHRNHIKCPKCKGYGLIGPIFKPRPCPKCGGDGHTKPPGWPNPQEMNKHRPPPPPLPPKP